MIKFVAELVHAFALQFFYTGVRLVGPMVSGTTVADLVAIATAFALAIVAVTYHIGPRRLPQALFSSSRVLRRPSLPRRRKTPRRRRPT